MDETSTQKLIELLETMADKLNDQGETLVILAKVVPLITQLADQVKGQQEIILSLQQRVNIFQNVFIKVFPGEIFGEMVRTEIETKIKNAKVL